MANVMKCPSGDKGKSNTYGELVSLVQQHGEEVGGQEAKGEDVRHIA